MKASSNSRFPGVSATFFLTLLLAFAPRLAQAQVDTGAIVGQVTDAGGAAILNAHVTLKEESTGVTTHTTTGAAGDYTVSPVKLGTYTVTVESPGFKTSIREHVEVTIQSRIEVNARLEIGSVSESVNVTSSSPILETQSSSVQQLVDTRAINDLPLNGRNATFLAQLSPGVTIAQNDSRNLQATGSFSANGLRRTQNNYLLDGMDDNAAIADLVNQAQYVVLPPPDALREFTVQTSNYSAEFGHSAGAVLNVTTKSGANAFHGNVWEYLRNDFFDAKDYFVLPTQRKPEFRQNQFGATIGGPIVIPKLYDGRNRSFFFADYQGTRIVQGKTYTESIPTAAETASNFTNLQDLITLQSGTYTDALGRVFPVGTVFDPATTRTLTANTIDPVTGIRATAAGYVRDPFYAGSLSGVTSFNNAAAIALLNQLPSARISPTAVALLKLYPAPNAAGLVSNYTISPATTTSTDSFDTRFDQQFSQRDSAFARYSFVYTTQLIPGPFAGIADGSASRPGSGHTESQNVAVSWTHILTPRLVNEARIGFSRVADRRLQYDATVMGIPDQYGIPGVPQIPDNGGLPLLTFGQLANLGSASTLPSDKASDVLQFTENVTADRSRHQLRAGFEFQHVAFPTLTPTYPRGDFANTGLYTSVVNSTDPSTDRAQFVLNPSAATVPNGIGGLGGSNTVNASSYPPAFYLLRQYFGTYVQDTWRATQTLTLNLGVRYEFIGVPTERDGRFANLVPAATGDSPDHLSHYYVPQSQIANLPTAFQALLAKDNILLTPTAGNTLAFAAKNNFAPRLGFSFQARPKLVIRGGYGLFYQANENHGLSISPWINFPFQVTSSFSAGSAVAPVTPTDTVGPLSEGLLNVPLTAASASVGSLSLEGQPRYPKTPYSQDYNLQLQYQVTPNTIAFLGYVGSNSRHVQVGIPANTVSSILPPSANSRTNSFFPDFAVGGTYVAQSGASNYNSLQLGVEHRFSSGFSFTANLTYSKCMGDERDLLDNGIGSYRAPYVTGIGSDTTLCDIDVRRVVHTSGTYELPFGRNKHYLTSGPAALLAGGWSTNWIFTAQDGQPFSVACTTTTASGLGCFALKVPGQGLYSGPHNVTQFLNPAAFANPPAATATSATVASLGGSPAQVSGPPFRRLDLSLFRRFTAWHETFFEFRAETFNITNTPNFGQPGSLAFTTPNTFARITATRDNPNDPREIQLSLKYYF
jgi:hypothetical protein